jgi:hypothetical protein
MAQKKAPPKSRAALLIDANLLGSPASGEAKLNPPAVDARKGVFPIYWVPQRVGRVDSIPVGDHLVTIKFPIYWVPQRVGSSNYAA